MEIDLNTADTEEYKHWLAILAELSRIQDALKDNPNEQGLKLARSHAYNLLADIQSMLDRDCLDSAELVAEELPGAQISS